MIRFKRHKCERCNALYMCLRCKCRASQVRVCPDCAVKPEPVVELPPPLPRLADRLPFGEYALSRPARELRAAPRRAVSEQRNYPCRLCDHVSLSAQGDYLHRRATHE
jgi:hypothetical protein